MTKTNYLLCSGEACPLRMTCVLWQNWLDNEDDDSEEMIPSYHDGKCSVYEQKNYFYGG